MKVVRHCRERLPGGEASWRSLAKRAGWDGTLYVYGYGVGNTKPGREQRRASYSESLYYAAVADYDLKTHEIRVWLPAPCGVAVDFPGSIIENFSHELGHYILNITGRACGGEKEEKLAWRIGRKLLREM